MRAAVLTLVLLAGCALLMRQPTGPSWVAELSPEPGIPLSEDPVRSPGEDVLLFLPEGWITLELGELAPAGVVATAVNPEYTLGLVLVFVRSSSPGQVATYDLLQLAQESFQRRLRRTGAGVKLSGDYQLLRIGPRTFVTYRFAQEGVEARAAVFVSSAGNVYEVVLLPLKLRPIEPPAPEEQERLFTGVLRALLY
jgi:hypothetical protein